MYFVLFAWLASTAFWLTQMNKGLSKFDGLFIIPVLQVFWTFYSIVSGGIYFEEFDAFSPEQMLGFCSGVSVVFVGVYLLAPGGGGEETIEIGDGDDASQTEMMELNQPTTPTPQSGGGAVGNRARGFSFDPEDPTQSRMVNVWTTSNDPGLNNLLDKEAKAMDKVGRGMHMNIMRKNSRDEGEQQLTLAHRDGKKL